MKLIFENIGKVNRADIEIKSISVITGINNSGKSTVGKLLYSISTALTMLQNNFLVYNKYTSIINELDGIRRWISSERYDELFMECNDVLRMLNRASQGERNEEIMLNEDINNLEITIDKMINEMVQLVYVEIEQSSNSSKDKLFLSMKNLEERRKRPVDDMFSKTSLFEETLNLEFSGSLISEYSKDASAFIQLKEDNGDNVTLVYKNAMSKFNNNEINITRTYSDSFYIDDSFLLDDTAINMIPMIHRNNRHFYNAKHRIKLLRKIRTADQERNLFDEAIQDKKIINIFSKVLGGGVRREKTGYVFFSEQLKNGISFESLSAGMKVFSIIQILIEKGLLNNNEYLIFDEPETHLHPEWQLKFAELIVLLSINFPVRILVISHSPYFLEAIDIYSRKYNVSDKLNFYNSVQSTKHDEVVDIVEVTDRLEEVFQDMYRPLSFLEELRDDLD